MSGAGISTDQPLLAVRDLTVEFSTPRGRLRAVDQLSFDVAGGEIVAIVGESGSGKTVTGLTLLGLTRAPNVAISGHVWFGSRDLIPLSDEEIRRFRGTEIAMIFQDPLSSLNPVRTIGAQIAESIRYHGGGTRRAAQNEAARLLGDVGIPNPQQAARAYPHEFSGGMRQRAMIALALAAHPRLLVADEPTTALDVTIQAQILELIEQLAREQGLGVVLISHDLAVVESVANRAIVMYAASVMESGRSEDLFKQPLHPYTWSLTRAVPRTTGPKLRRLETIDGLPPSLVSAPPGCRFEPRCPVAIERCNTPPPRRERQSSGDATADRFFVCWHEEPELALASVAADRSRNVTAAAAVAAAGGEVT